MSRFEVAVVGGGIVGLATAYQLLRQRPGLRLALLEKEAGLAQHQTGRNSGVLHSGIYYKPGSMKATTCRTGKADLEAFCEAESLPLERCGKVIVATSTAQVPLLHALYERGRANGVRCRLIDRGELAEREPFAAGVAAIHVEETGIVDYKAVCARLAEKIEAAGGVLYTRAPVERVVQASDHVALEAPAVRVEAAQVVNCAGLHADRVSRLSGHRPGLQIVPFRGEYFVLKPEAHHLCRSLIYPVPDPNFPFLGVHLTRMVEGGVECGPNAVLAFAREGYTRTTVHWGDLAETLGFAGFRKLAAKHWRMGMGEMWRSFSKAAFVRALQVLVPALKEEHLVPAEAGVRAQAVAPTGSLVDDFAIERQGRLLHVLNAPSPAATASLSIGAHIAASLRA